MGRSSKYLLGIIFLGTLGACSSPRYLQNIETDPVYFNTQDRKILTAYFESVESGEITPQEGFFESSGNPIFSSKKVKPEGTSSSTTSASPSNPTFNSNSGNIIRQNQNFNSGFSDPFFQSGFGFRDPFFDPFFGPRFGSFSRFGVGFGASAFARNRFGFNNYYGGFRDPFFDPYYNSFNSPFGFNRLCVGPRVVVVNPGTGNFNNQAELVGATRNIRRSTRTRGGTATSATRQNGESNTINNRPGLQRGSVNNSNSSNTQEQSFDTKRKRNSRRDYTNIQQRSNSNRENVQRSSRRSRSSSSNSNTRTRSRSNSQNSRSVSKPSNSRSRSFSQSRSRSSSSKPKVNSSRSRSSSTPSRSRSTGGSSRRKK